MKTEILNKKIDKVIDIISHTLHVDKKKVIPKAHIVNDLGADSLDMVEVIMDIENQLDIEIVDDDAEKMQTVDDVITYIKNYTKQ